ncbi:MAG: tRNA pseudouridine(55) synthase TruB [Ignavibacteriae bacterium]|nr:MAG: tRNA pseudouridine(55) synthase TruB [Ignavibacteriota bacterium]
MVTKQTSDYSKLDFKTGEVLLIDKPHSWTSFKVVNKIRKAVNVRRVGHAGTLDPNATGLLILCTGKKTKEIYKYQDSNKTYSGIITLGLTSPSMDTETETKAHTLPEKLDEEQINNARDQFIGEIAQIPPMYSALKVDGQKLYKLARKGKTVKREPRRVTIYSFDILKIDLPDIHFEISCSKGTYIRVIANDFGEKIGCGGILSKLRRTKIGEYSVNDALEVDQFLKGIEGINLPK